MDWMGLFEEKREGSGRVVDQLCCLDTRADCHLY